MSKLAGEHVQWFTNNQNVSRILSVGSKTADLQEEAYAISSISIANCIRIEPKLVPRKENRQADYLTHVVDHDNWQIDPRIFAELNYE